MSNATLDQYHAAILAHLTAELDAVVNISEYNPAVAEVGSPAVVMSLDRMQWDAATDSPEGLLLHCEWSLYCLVGVNVPGASRDVRNFAAEVSRLIYRASNDSRFGYDNILALEDLYAMPSVFDPDNAKYECWVVAFDQAIELPELFDDAALVPFVTFNAEHTQAPLAPVAEDTVTLPQP